MARPRVYRGLEVRVGTEHQIRVVITDVHNEKASVHVIFNNETTLGSGSTCPVASIEKLLDSFENNPLGE